MYAAVHIAVHAIVHTFVHVVVFAALPLWRQTLPCPLDLFTYLVNVLFTFYWLSHAGVNWPLTAVIMGRFGFQRFWSTAGVGSAARLW